jgi:hypothetical protein
MVGQSFFANTPMAKPLVVGIHGVGYSTSGTVRSAIALNLGVGVEDIEISEVYWSDVFNPDDTSKATLDPRSITRIARSMLVTASQDFDYNCRSKNNSTLLQSVIRFADSVVYLALVALAFLGPAVLLVWLWFVVSSWFGYSQDVSQLVLSIPSSWIFTTAIIAIFTTLIGFVRQIEKGGFSKHMMVVVAARIALRRTILTLFGPVFGVTCAMGSGLWLRGIGSFLTFFSIFTVLAFPVINFLMRIYLKHAGESSEEIERGLPHIYFSTFLYAIGFSLAILVLSFIWYRTARPIVKIVSDVLVYLGDFRYRQRLWLRTNSILIPAAATGRTMVLCGHSLGSVIAFDTLRHLSNKIGGSCPLIFVTAGSPLYHLLWRFFPRQYPAPRDMATRFSAVVPRFAWLNVFRPFDPIGTRLQLNASPNLSEVCTGQYFASEWLRGNFLAQHLDYFSDPKVSDLVSEFVRKCLSLERHETFSVQQANAVPARQTSPHLSRRSVNQIAWLTWWAGFLLLAFMVFIELPRMIVDSELRQIGEVIKHYQFTYGRLEINQGAALRIPWSGRALTRIDYIAEIVFRPLGLTTLVRTRPFDCDARAAFKQATSETPPVRRPINRLIGSITNVLVVYDKNHPDRCFLPRHRAGTWTRDDRLGWQAFLFALLLFVWTLFLRFSSGMGRIRDIDPKEKARRLHLRNIKRTSRGWHRSQA